MLNTMKVSLIPCRAILWLNSNLRERNSSAIQFDEWHVRLDAETMVRNDEISISRLETTYHFTVKKLIDKLLDAFCPRILYTHNTHRVYCITKKSNEKQKYFQPEPTAAAMIPERAASQHAAVFTDRLGRHLSSIRCC